MNKSLISAKNNVEKRRAVGGCCHYCGKKSDTRSCHECREKAKNYKSARHFKFKEEGKCTDCGGEKLPNALMCEKHYFMDLSRRTLLTTKHWSKLKEMLCSQNYECFYTGDKLTLGINASIDHLTPKKSNEPHVYTIENLVWCDRHINTIKNSLTMPEFIALCRKISTRFTNEPVELSSIEGAKKQETLPR